MGKAKAAAALVLAVATVMVLSYATSERRKALRWLALEMLGEIYWTHSGMLFARRAG